MLARALLFLLMMGCIFNALDFVGSGVSLRRRVCVRRRARSVRTRDAQAWVVVGGIALAAVVWGVVPLVTSEPGDARAARSGELRF